MKKLLTYFLPETMLLLFAVFPVFSQLSQPGTPLSDNFIMSEPEDTTVIYLPMSESRSFRTTAGDEPNGMPPKVGVSLNVGKSITECGSWEQLPNGDLVWRVVFSSPGAKAIGVVFSEYHLAEGSELYVYNGDKSQVSGAFTRDNNNSSGILTVVPVKGETITVELNMRNPQSFDTELVISELIYIYGDHQNRLSGRSSSPYSDSCFVSVNCSPEGDGWQNAKRGVAQMTFVQNGEWYVCSGSLVNNTRQDGTPYFLTAYHCGGATSDTDKAKSYFVFDFEESGCDNGDISLGNKKLSGCKRIAYSSYNGGSDMLLLKISETPPDNWNLYWNGWDYTATQSTSGVCIHHPAEVNLKRRQFKRISTYSTRVSPVQYPCAKFEDGVFCGLSYGYWGVTWSRTPNGYGSTAPGSSGSPLFNANKRIIGTLTGGASTCADPNPKDAPDYFGRFDIHWNYFDESPETQLAPWLDPLGITNGSFDGLFYTGLSDYTQIDDLSSIVWRVESGAVVIRWDRDEPRQAQIYNANGQLIETKTLYSGENRWNLNPNAFYLIRIGDETIKVSL
ncbi:MAG: trypsin-like serine protease [Bacteroidales bacterium]|nr:trypsin-like serine protease [Bacteroidales bacterium]